MARNGFTGAVKGLKLADSGFDGDVTARFREDGLVVFKHADEVGIAGVVGPSISVRKVRYRVKPSLGLGGSRQSLVRLLGDCSFLVLRLRLARRSWRDDLRCLLRSHACEL